jgi:hypothetical protein
MATLALLCVFADASQAAPVAHILSAEGLTVAVGAHEKARYVVAGDALNEGDTIVISRRGFAILTFIDGTRMTLRAGTRLAIDKFAHKGEEIARLRLLKGGVRAITGRITERNPEDGFRIDSAVGEVRVHGTDFDVRLCEADCAAAGSGTLVNSPVVARVQLLQGKLTAKGQSGKTRKLVRGGSVYQRDTLMTAPAAYAVLAFRDDSRVTLQGGTRFAVENYHYDPAKPQDNSIVLRLLEGAVRVTTGQVGKKTPKAYQLATPTAAVRPAGTGFDLICDERCAHPGPDSAPDDGLYVSTWNGTVELELPSEVVRVERDQSAFLGTLATRAVVLGVIPDRMRNNPAPRPDVVAVDIQALFGVSAGGVQPGLYVLVRDGHVTLSHQDSVVELGRDEAGRVDSRGSAIRLDSLPPALLEDPTAPAGGAGANKPEVVITEESESITQEESESDTQEESESDTQEESESAAQEESESGAQEESESDTQEPSESDTKEPSWPGTGVCLP